MDDKLSHLSSSSDTFHDTVLRQSDCFILTTQESSAPRPEIAVGRVNETRCTSDLTDSIVDESNVDASEAQLRSIIHSVTLATASCDDRFAAQATTHESFQQSPILFLCVSVTTKFSTTLIVGMIAIERVASFMRVLHTATQNAGFCTIRLQRRRYRGKTASRQAEVWIVIVDIDAYSSETLESFVKVHGGQPWSLSHLEPKPRPCVLDIVALAEVPS